MHALRRQGVFYTQNQKGTIIMTNAEFIEKAKQIVADYAREHLDKTEIVPPFDVFVVWNCYILGNHKALLSTTMPDGMYYEVTYNATRDKYISMHIKSSRIVADSEYAFST